VFGLSEAAARAFNNLASKFHGVSRVFLYGNTVTVEHSGWSDRLKQSLSAAAGRAAKTWSIPSAKVVALPYEHFEVVGKDADLRRAPTLDLKKSRLVKVTFQTEQVR